jgi:hypothetical protein
VRPRDVDPLDLVEGEDLWLWPQAQDLLLPVIHSTFTSDSMTVHDRAIRGARCLRTVDPTVCHSPRCTAPATGRIETMTAWRVVRSRWARVFGNVTLATAVVGALVGVPLLTGQIQRGRAQLASDPSWDQLWGQWLPWAADHLVWALGSVVLVTILLERRHRNVVWIVVGVVAAAMPLGLPLVCPRADYAACLGGLNAALFVALGFVMLRAVVSDRITRRMGLATLLSLGFLGKVGITALGGGDVVVHQAANHAASLVQLAALAVAMGVAHAATARSPRREVACPGS